MNFLLVQLDEFVEPIGEHIENRVTEVDEFDMRMKLQQRFQVQYRVFRRTETGVYLLVRVYLAEVTVAAVGAVIKTAAADDDYRGVYLGAFKVIVVEQVKIGDRYSVKVGKQRTDGILYEFAVFVLEPEAFNRGLILSGGHFVKQLKLGIFAVAYTYAVNLGNRKHLGRRKRTMIAAADYEYVGIYLPRPFYIQLAVGERGSAYRKTDYIKFSLLTQLFFIGFLIIEMSEVKQ